MYTLPQILGFISGVFLIGGYVPYIVAVLKKRDVPSRASWLIWSISTLIIFFDIERLGVKEAIWVPVADALGCFIILVLAIKYGIKGWKRVDVVSFVICLASLAVWYLTGEAFIALVMNLFIYISGYFPTIQKAIREPGSEDLTAWTLFFIGVLLNLVTVALSEEKGFEFWLYPVALVLTVGTLYAVILMNPKKKLLC